MSKTRDAITKPEVRLIISIVSPLLAIAVMWGSMSSKIDAMGDFSHAHVEDYDDHVLVSDSRYDDTKTTLLQIQIQLAEIQKDILYIKERQNGNQ